MKATTVVAVRHNGQTAIGADGQATLGHTVFKSTVNKIRKLADGKVLAGFAGSTADAFTLLGEFENHLNKHTNNMYRAALSFAKEWRTNKYLRRLEATMITINQDEILVISGAGDVMRPDKDFVAIGSGGNYAYAAATVLKEYASQLTAHQIVEKSLKVAADLCIYTNHNRIIETIEKQPVTSEEADKEGATEKA